MFVSNGVVWHGVLGPGEKPGRTREAFLVWDTGHSIDGGFAPGLPWRRRSKRFASRRVSFFMGRFARTQPGGSGLDKSRVAREKLVGLGHGRSMGGDSEPWRLGCLGGGAKCNQRQKTEGLCNSFRAHGLNPLGSMSWETHKKSVLAYCVCTPTRSRRMGGWADGWTCKNFRRDFAPVSGRMV